jgi:2'-5' RNA ligase
MRLFWAIELPEDAQACLIAVQRRLRTACPDGVRWARREQLHVTCRFIGEARSQRPIVAAARELPHPGPLALQLRDLGWFGGRQPKVLWAGIGGADLEALQAHVAALDRAMTTLGFTQPDTRFVAHVTLGRPRSGPRSARPGALRTALREIRFDPVDFVTRELVLMSSSHGEQAGPSVYTPEARVELV